MKTVTSECKGHGGMCGNVRVLCVYRFLVVLNSAVAPFSLLSSAASPKHSRAVPGLSVVSNQIPKFPQTAFLLPQGLQPGTPRTHSRRSTCPFLWG